MSKLNILVFSDCYIYGGSEKLMAFLLKNEVLNKNFNFLYSYRKHKGYELGLKNEELLGRVGSYPLILLSNETLFHHINNVLIPSVLKKIVKVPFFLFEKIGFYFIWNLLVLIFMLLKTKPDLIHINNGGYPAAKSCNILVVANYLTIQRKIIYQVNNQARNCKGYFERLYDKFIHNSVACFINASNKAKEQLVEKRNFNPNKILVVSNCVPLPEVKVNREQIIRELNLPSDCFLIVQVAFLSERKGQRYLINALSDLYKKQLVSKKKLFCVFVGNGEDDAFLIKSIDELGLNSNIFLLGYRNNSEDFISASDLFVLPSIRDEDMPLVLLSALGYGKPIISTNFAGISQVIQTNVNGVLIENNLSTFRDDLANEIFRLYNDEELRLQLGVNAKKSYTNYSPKSYGLKLKSIYEQVYAS
ncbi:glycosyltransferase [Flavobacterium sp. I-SCBP12n]|uniref:Glycosyltransferase n=1 Tax=Flavobacterium pygoscelis TaxID=2893176 RepID=A0A9X1XPM2_9FLAO|nr:glycosyltransferase [Flavobacterium pygoscelis]MCK8141465.1 glycosyltransferase [Flavobacterium pygoscelis]